MTTLQDHIEHVESHSFDQTAALALVDRMQEESSFTPIAALRRVAKIRRPNRQAKWLADAAKLMRLKSRSAMMARDHVVSSCMWGAFERAVVILVTGFRSPAASRDYLVSPGHHPFRVLVSVGAREFIRLRNGYLKSLRSLPKFTPGLRHTTRGARK